MPPPSPGMEPLGSLLGCSAAVAMGVLVFSAYKLGVLYQLFHKVTLGRHHSTRPLQTDPPPRLNAPALPGSVTHLCGDRRLSQVKGKKASVRVDVDRPCGFLAQRLSQHQGAGWIAQRPLHLCRPPQYVVVAKERRRDEITDR